MAISVLLPWPLHSMLSDLDRITRHASFGSPTRERRQSGWGTFFAGGVSQANANTAGLSPTRAAEMKKALKAVLDLGPKAGEERVRSGTPQGRTSNSTSSLKRRMSHVTWPHLQGVTDRTNQGHVEELTVNFSRKISRAELALGVFP